MAGSKLWDRETNVPKNPVQDAAVRDDWDKAYRGAPPFDRMRRSIDVGKTLAQADQRFASGEIFRSATEICELHLVRTGENLADYQSGAVWRDALITGDNTRERPYTNLYARLTTRSNTFTVHLRVQALRHGGTQPGDWTVWREERSQPVGEYRGSALVERYIDPADPNLPDFATAPDAVADFACRIRTLATRKFVP